MNGIMKLILQAVRRFLFFVFFVAFLAFCVFGILYITLKNLKKRVELHGIRKRYIYIC